MQREKNKKLHDFKFGTFVGRFGSDGKASMAVKGLKNKIARSLALSPLGQYAKLTLGSLMFFQQLLAVQTAMSATIVLIGKLFGQLEAFRAGLTSVI